MCFDYRTLNPKTILDQYTLSCTDDAGYYEITMSEEDKEKTTFTCPLGFYFIRFYQLYNCASACSRSIHVDSHQHVKLICLLLSGFRAGTATEVGVLASDCLPPAYKAFFSSVSFS